MKRVILRFLLAIVFGFIGAFVARVVLQSQLVFFIVIAIFSFGILGFILPEFIELSGKAGIAAFAAQISKYLQVAQSPYINIPKISFKRKKRPAKYINPLVIDTSVLIDGRILDITKTGFIFGTFVVIPSVISELHKLADSADPLKRVKGRRGLDNLEGLTREKKVKVELTNTEPSDEEVDLKLVAIARKLKGSLLTVDFNLNKVAKIKKVSVLNINELTGALKSVIRAGEKLNLEIRDKGSGKDQGVGYLADGTMVVVEGGLSYKGKSIDVEVLRVLQTAAGKMAFAKPA